MFNDRPDGLSPWLYVERLSLDDPPGFRTGADGSVRNLHDGAAFAPFGSNSRAGAVPAIDADFEGAIRSIADPAGYLSHGAVGLAPLSRAPIREALDQIVRIYADAGTKLSGPFGRQNSGAGMVVPADVRPRSSYGESSLPPATEPVALQSSWRSESHGNPQPRSQIFPSTQFNGHPLLERSWLGRQPMPMSATSEPGSLGTRPIAANDVQVAQAAPAPQQRRQNPSVNPRPQRSASELGLQVQATQRLNTQLARANTWEDVIRQPLPEKIESWMQKPLPDDWEGTLNKMDSQYVKWTRAAAEKYGIPPELLARLFYKESNYDRKSISGAGARGIAQLTPIAIKALGLDPSTFEYSNAEKSIDAGAALLAKYYAEFKDWGKAVAAYNMGNTAVRQWLAGDRARGPDEETQFLLRHVFRGDPHAFGRKP